MNQLKVYAELHWAVQRPNLIFAINHTHITSQCHVLRRENFVDLVIYTLQTGEFYDQNTLSIEMTNKNNDMITNESDHWANIVNIEINGIPAEQMLLTNTRFEHAMPKIWCDEMVSQGIIIQDVYIPGTEIRLNGTCFFEFGTPFLIQRIINEWNHQ
jgi:hypothetical protein